jgi:hypothetical protein
MDSEMQNVNGLTIPYQVSLLALTDQWVLSVRYRPSKCNVFDSKMLEMHSFHFKANKKQRVENIRRPVTQTTHGIAFESMLPGRSAGKFHFAGELCQNLRCIARALAIERTTKRRINRIEEAGSS